MHIIWGKREKKNIKSGLNLSISSYFRKVMYNCVTHLLFLYSTLTQYCLQLKNSAPLYFAPLKRVGFDASLAFRPKIASARENRS